MVVIISLYLSIVLPIIVVLLWGISLLRKKSVLNKVNVLAFASIWFIALVTAGISTSRLVYKLDSAMKNDPLIVRQTITTPLESFNSIVVLDSNDIEVVRGDTYSVQFEGSKRDIDKVLATVSDSTLTVQQSSVKSAKCVFCDNQSLSIIVTVPSVSTISLQDNSSLVADLNLSELTLSLEDSSRATLSGGANTLVLSLKDSSSFNGQDYRVSNASVDLRDSSDALVDVGVRLSGTAQDSSSLTYTGEPKVDVKTISSSSVRPAQEDLEQYQN